MHTYVYTYMHTYETIIGQVLCWQQINKTLQQKSLKKDRDRANHAEPCENGLYHLHIY